MLQANRQEIAVAPTVLENAAFGRLLSDTEKPPRLPTWTEVGWPVISQHVMPT